MAKEQIADQNFIHIERRYRLSQSNMAAVNICFPLFCSFSARTAVTRPTQ